MNEQWEAERISKTLTMLAGIEALWTEPVPKGEALTAAISCWSHFPMMYETGLCHKSYETRIALIRVHDAASMSLMGFAESLGIDPRPIWECGRACVNYFTGDYPRDHDGLFSGDWPNCLSSKVRCQLPATMQQAIAAGEATFRQLCLRAELQAAEPKADAAFVPLSVAMKGYHFTDREVRRMIDEHKVPTQKPSPQRLLVDAAAFHRAAEQFEVKPRTLDRAKDGIEKLTKKLTRK